MRWLPGLRTACGARAGRDAGLVEGVDAVGIDVEREVPGRLDGVCMEGDATPKLAGAFSDKFCRLGDRLDRPHFVVRQHDRHEDRTVVYGARDIIRINPSLTVHRQ